jgi:hypothetical protein
MVKDEKNKYFNVANKNLIFSHQNKRYILPNKGFKKFSLDSNKVWKSEAISNYI